MDPSLYHVGLNGNISYKRYYSHPQIPNFYQPIKSKANENQRNGIKNRPIRTTDTAKSTRQRDLEQSVSSLQPEGRDITTFQPVVEGHPIPDVKQGYQYLGPGKPIPFDAPINQNQLERGNQIGGSTRSTNSQAGPVHRTVYKTVVNFEIQNPTKTDKAWKRLRAYNNRFTNKATTQHIERNEERYFFGSCSLLVGNGECDSVLGEDSS
ncbi:uncharacterized protein LOC142345456 [Convolutriloba macropyga]|uniref:uncharacterized protein LOC142345456 n=1 Tax=Convolutriloba macropyga TaxID=536237 RepID=UPI003F52206D